MDCPTPEYCPTPQQIREACAAIQATWSPDKERRRRADVLLKHARLRKICVASVQAAAGTRFTDRLKASD